MSTARTQQKYYVTMTDKFMSGWGVSDKKINKLVIECDSMDEAEIVADNGRARSEMLYVSIRSTKPYYDTDWYLTSYHTKEDYGSWFEKGYFSK